MQKLAFILVLLFTTQVIIAKEFPMSKAGQLALNFMSERSEIQSLSVLNVLPISYQNQVVMYVVNFNNANGFVVLSADDRAKPVIAFVESGTYGITNEPVAFTNQMQEYAQEIQYIISHQIAQTSEIKSQWKKYLSPLISKGIISAQPPLLTTLWSQGCYYNDSTPVAAGGPCSHVVTGCVATAMAQVINYHNFPNTGSGSHSYNSAYGNLTANFGQTTYNWNLMANVLSASSTSAEVASVAQLISQCGIAVDMMYSPGSSGAYSQDAAIAFTHFFNFDNGLALLHKSNYNDSIWELMIRTELDSFQPVYYNGSGTGGHAFVCDGYQNDGYFHFNWGWSGSYNGYFTLSNLNPGGMNFSDYCGAVIGMKPGIASSCNGITDTLTQASGNFSDGSYGAFYQDNANCSWLIAPANASSIRIDFFTFDVQPGDSVYLYDGVNAQASLLGAYSGLTLPNTLYSSGGNVYIEFISNSTANSAGWSASYQVEYCQGQTVLNSISGSLSDGSGLENYINNTSCSWLISDNLNRPINLVFDFFKTEAAFDFVNIYDGINASGNLLGSYSGNTLPPLSMATSGNMFIEFTSDGGVVDEGWSANYYICAQPAAPYSLASTQFCQGDSIALVIDSAVDSFLWVVDGAPQLGNLDTAFYIHQSGQYKYIAFAAGCNPDTSNAVAVQVNAIPLPHLGADTLLCTYHNLMLNPGTFSTYLWNTNDTTATLFVDSTLINQYGSVIVVEVQDSNNCINSDTINISLSPCLAINASSSLSAIKLFPNPAVDRLWISNTDHQSIEISITDAIGREVLYQEMKSDNLIEINVAELKSGAYYVILRKCTDKRVIKFIKN